MARWYNIHDSFQPTHGWSSDFNAQYFADNRPGWIRVEMRVNGVWWRPYMQGRGR